MAEMQHKPFYVYVIYDPRPAKNNAPIYVGKGQGDRSEHHRSFATNLALKRIIAKCVAGRLDIEIRKVRHFDRETDAFLYEKQLIARYGRRDLKTGTLCNVTDGGEGVSGIIRDEKYRDACRRAAERRYSDPEQIVQLAKACQLRSAGPEYLATLTEANRRSRADPEVLAKLTAANRRKAADPVLIVKWTESNRRKAADPEFRAKLSKGSLRGWVDLETREKRIASMRGIRKSPEHRAKLRAAAQRQWAAKRAAISASEEAH